MVKTPEEIKKGLNVLYPPSSQTTYSEYVEAIACIPDALALIEQLEREKKDLLEERELNEFLRDKVKKFEAQVPKWISIEERLPEEDGISVLCAVKTYGGTCVCEGYYSKRSNRVWPVDEDIALDKVTHWMPLPEPPKEDDHAER